MASTSLSLYIIEDSLAELLAAWDDLIGQIEQLASIPESQATPDVATSLIERRQELAIVERTLREYVTLEVRKADNIHRYLTTAKAILAARKAEAKRMTEGAKQLESSIDRLERLTMAAMIQGGKTRLDGTNGRYLLRKKNGSVAPLQVDGWNDDTKTWFQEPVLPEEFMDVTVVLPLSDWKRLLAQPDAPLVDATVKGGAPSNKRIRGALAQDCDSCDGKKTISSFGKVEPCEKCAGTGKQLVPGARLTERGEHLEVK